MFFYRPRKPKQNADFVGEDSFEGVRHRDGCELNPSSSALRHDSGWLMAGGFRLSPDSAPVLPEEHCLHSNTYLKALQALLQQSQASYEGSFPSLEQAAAAVPDHNSLAARQ